MNLSPNTRLSSVLVTLLLVFTAQCFANSNPAINFNQVGFLTLGPKIAMVPDVPQIRFTLVDASSNEEVYSGPLSDALEWPLAGQKYKIADFSDFETPGRYTINLEGLAPSNEIIIGSGLYQDALHSTLKAFYFNRASAALEEKHAGKYTRPAAHPDTIVYIHQTATSKARPLGTVISSPKGWYDAGDYNKYIVPSNFTTYVLLQALTDYKEQLATLHLNIPESGNQLPDLIDEVLWNLDWMLSMQDPNDGGVYHKLTTKRFTRADIMPHTQYQPRYVVAKSSPATFGFAAATAQAARILKPYKKLLPGLEEKLIKASTTAWQWGIKNPKVFYEQPRDIETGTYASPSETGEDDRFWAAAELFALTGDKKYLKKLELPKEISLPSWYSVGTLGVLTLAEHPKTPKKLKQKILTLLKTTADSWALQWQENAIGVPIMEDRELRWGSNGYLMNKAFTLLRINRIMPNSSYLLAARGSLDYIFGRNPLGYSFVTGFGTKPPMNIHHRASNADGIKDPIPGWLAGGPNKDQQDKKDCKAEGFNYPSKLPALSYIDEWCSFASNEITIYWNAPLVYVLAAFQE